MQYKHLVCVTGQNNNKYYDMREKPDGTFDATYGRIGVKVWIYKGEVLKSAKNAQKKEGGNK